MQKLRPEHKYFMGGFLAGFGFYTAVFFLGYFWRLRQLLG
jgi:hypothetical protein